MTGSQNGRYQSRFGHGDCHPVNERCDVVEHTRWRVTEVGKFIASDRKANADLLARAEELGFIPSWPGPMRGDPGE